MNNFDPYNVFLAIAANIPQRLKTDFVLQSHIYVYNSIYIFWSKCDVKKSQIINV